MVSPCLPCPVQGFSTVWLVLEPYLRSHRSSFSCWLWNAISPARTAATPNSLISSAPLWHCTWVSNSLKFFNKPNDFCRWIVENWKNFKFLELENFPNRCRKVNPLGLPSNETSGKSAIIKINSKIVWLLPTFRFLYSKFMSSVDNNYDSIAKGWHFRRVPT